MTQSIYLIRDWLWLACTVLVLIGCVYSVTSASLLNQLARRTKRRPLHFPSVSMLKPLHGAEPFLKANLQSFDAQDYPGAAEIVCGVGVAGDPAASVVCELQGTTRLPLHLAVAAPDIGPNRKISNLANMLSLSQGELLILSDSDMRVEPGYVSEIAAHFDDPATGAVTCLYRGVPAGGFWSRVHAASIDHHFLPNAVTGLALGLATPCFGSTIALRRSMLKRIGGFGSFADKLADDYEIGRAVRATGANVAVPPTVLVHMCSESSLGEVFAHELRWAKTVRLIDPAGYAGSLVTHPFPLSLIAVSLAGFSATGFAIVALALVCRSFVPVEMRRSFKAEGSSVALGPLRDLLSFAVFLAGFLPFTVTWKGLRYKIRRDGTMVPYGD
jgi:ceramide glucosyltransferase